MKLTVLKAAYPLAPVGAEPVLTQPDAALAKAGHASIVIAGGGSVTRGTLLATPATTDALNQDVILAVQEAIRSAINLLQSRRRSARLLCLTPV